jgi:protocatechuate 3,4-dioxygenase beta subunit
MTGAPVPRAHVSLNTVVEGRPVVDSAVTGADGGFSTSGIAPGRYRISLRRTGFAMTPNVSPNLKLDAGESKRFDLQLAPTGAVTGRVTDENGEPVENANVLAEGQGGEGAVTDQNGLFRIGGLAPGRYRIKASMDSMYGGPPEIRTDGTTEAYYASTYYPGVLSKKQAGYVTVRSGTETSGADIPLVQAPFVRVSGKVIGMPADAANRTIMVGEAEPDVWSGWGVALRRDGSFEFWRLDAGKYTLRAEWNVPDGSQVHTATVDIEVAGSNVDNIALRVIPDSNIPGRIEYENDAARQALSAENSPLTINLRSAGGGDYDGDPAQVDKDGAFQLRKVPAARYKVAVSSQAVYVKSVRFGSTQSDGPDLDLSNGSRRSDLEVVVSAAAGSISGTVHDDQGSPVEAEIMVTPGEFSEDFEWRAKSKADGTYSFDHLRPGDYTIIAIPKASFDWLAGYDDQMDSFSIHGDEKVVKDLKLVTPGTP